MNTAIIAPPVAPTGPEYRLGVPVREFHAGDAIPTEARNYAVWVDPPLAADWLQSRNDKNRNIRGNKVEQFVDDIVSGRWGETRQPIAFDWNGMLSDGHHRLESVVKAGKGIWVVVAFGCDPKAVISVDRGSARTPADVLRLSGFSHATNIAAGMSKALQHEQKAKEKSRKAFSNSTSSAAKVLETAEADKPMWEAAGHWGKTMYDGMGRSLTPGAWTAIYAIVERVNHGTAEPFLQEILDGSGSAGSGTRIVRDLYFRRSMKEARKDTVKERGAYENLVRAYNQWVGGGSFVKARVADFILTPVKKKP